MRVPIRRNPHLKSRSGFERLAAAEPSRTLPSRWNEVVAELAADPRPFEELSLEERRARVAKIRGSLRATGLPSEEFMRRKQEEIDLEEAKLARSAG